MCELLLAHGAELTAKSSNLTTALHCAALNGNVEICELLISTGKMCFIYHSISKTQVLQLSL